MTAVNLSTNSFNVQHNVKHLQMFWSRKPNSKRTNRFLPTSKICIRIHRTYYIVTATRLMLWKAVTKSLKMSTRKQQRSNR